MVQEIRASAIAVLDAEAITGGMGTASTSAWEESWTWASLRSGTESVGGVDGLFVVGPVLVGRTRRSCASHEESVLGRDRRDNLSKEDWRLAEGQDRAVEMGECLRRN